MKKGLPFLMLVCVLSLLAASGLVAQEPPPTPGGGSGTIFVDPGPNHDWAPYEIDGPAMPSLPPPPVSHTDAAGQWDYVVYDTLIVIHTHTAAGSITPAQVERVKEQVRQVQEFLWRNSGFRLYLNLSWLVIDDYIDATEFKAPWSCGWLWPNDELDGDGESPEADMLAHGIVTSDYDSINFIWAHNNGTISACAGGLAWGSWSWSDGGHTAITTNALILAVGDDIENPFRHEFHHSIGGAFGDNGNPAYFNADYPWAEPYRFGTDVHFHSVMMRAWPDEDWFDLIGEWGRLAHAPDADGDRLPDSGDLPVTEATLGSSTAVSDSEGDGLSDRAEAMAGMFRAADPLAEDTDQDGRLDATDAYPLYDLATYIPQKTPTLNGSPSGWTLLTDTMTSSDLPLEASLYGSWGGGALHFMLVTSRAARINLLVDANGDGFWHGHDNYEFDLDTEAAGTGRSPIVWVGVQDCSPRQTNLKTYCQYDTDATYTFGRLVQPADFGTIAVRDGDKRIVQLSIPADPDTQFNPRYGDEVGLTVRYTHLDGYWLNEANTFARCEQVYLPLLSSDSGTLSGTVSGLGVCDDGMSPLPFTDIRIQGASGPVHQVQTDSEGRYSLPLRANQGPYTITVESPGYETAVITDVTIIPQGETVQDISLRLEASCMTAEPQAFAEELRLGEVITRELSITNTGAAAGDVTMIFSDFGLPLTTWVSIDPITATLPVAGVQTFDVRFDARPEVMSDPGLYTRRSHCAHQPVPCHRDTRLAPCRDPRRDSNDHRELGRRRAGGRGGLHTALGEQQQHH